MFEPTYGNRNAIVTAARSAIQTGDFPLAEDLLKSVLRADPNDAEAASLLASAVARNMAMVQQVSAMPRRTPIIIGSPTSFWNRQYRLSQPVLSWLYALGFSLGGLAQLVNSLPLMLTKGPDALYTYADKHGRLLTEPVKYAVVEGTVFLVMAVIFVIAALVLRRCEARWR